MIVLGIDPGLATVGYAFLSIDGGKKKILDMGTITTPPHLALSERLVMIETDLIDLIQKYSPDVCGVEELFFTKNVKTGIAVAHARGIILSTVSKHHILLIEFTPLEVKHQVTGDGKADKTQMKKMLELMFPNVHFSSQDDANDALAIALATSYSHSTSMK